MGEYLLPIKSVRPTIAHAPAIQDSSTTPSSKRVSKETLARLEEAEARLTLLNKEKGDGRSKFVGIILQYICWIIGLLVYSLMPWIFIQCDGVQHDVILVILVILVIFLYVCGWLVVHMMFYMLVSATKDLVRWTRQMRISHIRSLLDGVDVVIPVEYSGMPLVHFRKRRFEIEDEIEESRHYKYDETVILALLSVVVGAVMVLIFCTGMNMTLKGAT